MSSFDLQKWKSKIWDRYAKRISNSGLTDAQRLIETKHMAEESESADGLNELISWCNLKRINVEFTNRKCGGGYIGQEKTIYINSTQSVEKQLFILLHECGHLLIDNKNETTEFRFQYGYPASDPHIKRRFVHRCVVVEEEFEAWHRGRKLATKLGIKINDERFSSTKASMLKSYMRWALGDPRFQCGGPE